MFQDLFHPNNAKVNATLDALNHDSMKDNKKYEKLQVAGGCFALVHLMQNCLDKAIDEFPTCDQVTELNELAELTTLYKTLKFIINWTSLRDDRATGITAIGGVEVVAKVLQSFQSAMPCSGVAVAPSVTWQIAVLPRRKPSNRVVSRFFLQE
jgi:hypothetical protein